MSHKEQQTLKPVLMVKGNDSAGKRLATSPQVGLEGEIYTVHTIVRRDTLLNNTQIYFNLGESNNILNSSKLESFPMYLKKNLSINLTDNYSARMLLSPRHSAIGLPLLLLFLTVMVDWPWSNSSHGSVHLCGLYKLTAISSISSCLAGRW